MIKKSQIIHEQENVTATTVSPSDLSLLLEHLTQQGIDIENDPPRVLEQNESVDRERSGEFDRAERECKAIIRGIQIQKLTEFALIYQAFISSGMGVDNVNRTRIYEFVRQFYQNRSSQWVTELFTNLITEAMFVREYKYSIEELKQGSATNDLDAFFAPNDTQGHPPQIGSIKRMFATYLPNHLFQAHARNRSLKTPSEGSILNADAVYEIWFSALPDEEQDRIIQNVLSIFSGHSAISECRELLYLFNCINLATIRFEPSIAQQIESHPNDSNRKLQLSPTPDLLISRQEVSVPSSDKAFKTPPILVDIKTGGQFRENALYPSNELSHDIEDLVHLLAIMHSRVSHDPGAKKYTFGSLANNRHVLHALRQFSQNPWMNFRLYHYNPLSDRIANRIPLDVLPEELRRAYILDGRRLQPSRHEQSEIFDRLHSTLRLLDILGHWAAVNKKKKPWKKDESRFLIPQLKDPSKEYEGW